MSLPTGVAIGLGLLGTAGNIFGQSHASNLANQGALDAQNLANKQNIEFWKMQNAYNNPKEQMMRLRKAGLNPNLIYGSSPSSATGNADKIAPSKAAPYKKEIGDVNPLGQVMQYANIKNTEAQTDNLAVQNKVLAAERLDKLVSAWSKMGSGKSAHVQAYIDDALKNTSINIAEENLKRTRADRLLAETNYAILDKTKQDQIDEIITSAKIAAQRLEGEKKNNAIKAFEIQLNEVGLTKTDDVLYRIFKTNAEIVMPDKEAKDRWEEIQERKKANQSR